MLHLENSTPSVTENDHYYYSYYMEQKEKLSEKQFTYSSIFRTNLTLEVKFWIYY